MIEDKCQTPLAKATAELMGAWAFATSQPAIQTFNFWTRVFRSSLVFPGLALRVGGPQTMPRSDAVRAEPQTSEASKSPEQPGTQAEPGFAS